MPTTRSMRNANKTISFFVYHMLSKAFGTVEDSIYSKSNTTRQFSGSKVAVSTAFPFKLKDLRKQSLVHMFAVTIILLLLFVIQFSPVFPRL